MRQRLRAVIATAAWLLPAAVLVISGLAKIADPQGSMPHSLTRVAEFLPYSVLLRLLGAFELVVVAYLVVPRTRRIGALVALALFAAFTFLVAANAHDQDFLQNCGCFGGLGETGALKRLSGLGAILLRNSALCGLLAAHLLATGSTALRVWPSFGFGLGSAALVFFSAGFVAQRDMAAQRSVVQAALDEARQRCAFGLPLPEIGLVAPDRRATTSTRELREGDHVLFFSPTCPHCRRLAPALAGLSERLAKSGKRLVLIAVADAGGVAEFQRAFGLETRPHYAVAERMDPLRWGIDGVPKLVVMGPDGRAAYHDLQPGNAGLVAELSASGPRLEGLVPDARRRIIDALVGPGAPVPEFVQRGSLLLADARTKEGDPIKLCVGTVRGTPQHTLVLGFALDAKGTILRVVPLTVSGYAQVVDPEWRLFAPLPGSTLADAAKASERRADEATLEAPVWQSTGLLLAAMADELAPKPSPRANAPETGAKAADSGALRSDKASGTRAD